MTLDNHGQLAVAQLAIYGPSAILCPLTAIRIEQEFVLVLCLRVLQYSYRRLHNGGFGRGEERSKQVSDCRYLGWCRSFTAPFGDFRVVDGCVSISLSKALFQLTQLALDVRVCRSVD